MASSVRCVAIFVDIFFSLVGFYLLRCCTSCFMYQWTLSFILFLDVGCLSISFLNKGLGGSVYMNALFTMLCDFSRVLRVALLKLRMKALKGSSSYCRHPKIGWAFIIYHLCWIKCPTNASTDWLKSWMLSTGKLVYHNRATPDRVVGKKMHKYFSSK